MCGICGLWSTKIDNRKRVLHKMLDSLSHRGPDGKGTYFGRKSGLSFGHTRLSILELSDLAKQPFPSKNKRWVVTFNGEIYNFRELRTQLKGPFRSDGDTEVLVEGIAQWGLQKTLQKLNGMFAFAAYDTQEDKLYLVRDRLGIKPLYYGRVDGHFVFASELKVFRALPRFDNALNRDALASYMRYNYVPTPQSIFKEIHKLGPGQIATLDSSQGKIKIESYWNAEDVAKNQRGKSKRNDKEAIRSLDKKLRKSVAYRMISDVPFGAFLSGGIDSSTIVSIMQSMSDTQVNTFTIGFDHAGYDEAPWAKKIAQHLGCAHTELILSPQDALSVINKLPQLYDEPFSDSSQIPTFLVSQLARKKVTVALSGDGADEIFGGYNRHLWAPRIAKLSKIPSSFRKGIASALMAISSDRWEDIFERYQSRLPKSVQVRLPAEKLQKLAAVLPKNNLEIYQDLRSHWKDPEAIILGSKDRPLRDLSSDFSMTERIMLLDLLTYLPDDILSKVDRASMGVGLEARVPFLDHELVEFAWSLPENQKIRKGKTKWILREVLKNYVPESYFERPKMGFGIPIGHWLKSDLRDWAESLLSEHKLKDEGIFETQAVRAMWKEHLKGDKNWQHHLWDVLMFQAWNQEWKIN